MTLADLAAMAATVEGFRRPIRPCRTCGGSGESVHGFDSDPCECEAEPGAEWDNSPAALAMAVLVFAAKPGSARWAGVSDYTGEKYEARCSSGSKSASEPAEDNPESIARALLTALLRAHGVEVPNE